MLDYLYPIDERALFTDREHLLGLLELSAVELQQQRRKHLALLGLRRIGKTLILKEFILRWLQRPTPPGAPPVIPVYLDLKRLGLSPESFAIEYIGSGPVLVSGEGRGPLRMTMRACRPCYGPPARWAMPRVLDMVLELDADLRQQSIPQRRLLELAFNFPETLAREQGVRFLICIDEFQDLSLLSNFPQVGDALDIFRSVLQTQSAVTYVAAGSAISLMEGIFHQARSPLFVHFRSERVGPFGRAESEELARKALVGEELPAAAAQTLYEWTRGHPFYIYAVAERMRELILLSGRVADPAIGARGLCLGDPLQRRAHLQPLSLRDRGIHGARPAARRCCGCSCRSSPSRKAHLTLTEVAHRLRRPAGATRALLNRLGAVDLVAQADGAYDLPDPVLKIWLAYFHAGVELLTVPRREILEELVADMTQRYQRLSSELGLAKESQVRELLAAFAVARRRDASSADRRRGGGPCDCRSSPVSRPIRVLTARSSSTRLAEGPEPWLVEVKWRNRPMSRADLAALATKARAVV